LSEYKNGGGGGEFDADYVLGLGSFMQRLSSIWHRSPSLQALRGSKPVSAFPLKPNSPPKRLAHAALEMSPSFHQQRSAKETFANFDLIKRIKLDYTDVTVSKWRSRVTGLSVVHLDYEGTLSLWISLVVHRRVYVPAPLVNGYFVVPTESAP
jgi:hypothetical protein